MTGFPLGHVLANYLGNYGPDIGIQDIIPSIETLIWIIFTVIVVVCFVIAGIMFLTAQGAPEKLKTARSAFIWGIAGVVVGILAYSIIPIIINFLIYGR